MMERHRRSSASVHRGSALLLTVILTSLLAIVGVLFLMATRIDKMATAATADNREITFAVDSVVARIAEELARDVPRNVGQEYQDFPDDNDRWLADLEPRRSLKDPNVYQWGQISDVTGYLQSRKFAVEDVNVDPFGSSKVLPEYSKIELDPNGHLLDHPEANVDADGDGIADSKWIVLDDLMSSRGKSIYAAVRIVDNGGMLNVNTGFTFDANDPNVKEEDVDGHTQLQVNLLAMDSAASASAKAKLLGARANNTATAAALDLATYERDVIWSYGWLGDTYTPFDLSDELELRYRYCINSEGTQTRLERIWSTVGSTTDLVTVPYDSFRDARRSAREWRRLDDWCLRVTNDPNAAKADMRHLLTTYNLDRILAPRSVYAGPGIDPNKMLNVNTASDEAIKRVITEVLKNVNLAAFGDPAQMAANIKDYIDEDDEVTVQWGAIASSEYLGFERPCVYLSELVYRSVPNPGGNAPFKSFAVELCKPYFQDSDPRPMQWRIFIDNPTASDVTQVITWSGTRQFHVLLSENSQAPIKADHVFFEDLNTPHDLRSAVGYDPNRYSSPSTEALLSAGFSAGATISLQRRVNVNGQDKWPTVDQVRVPATFNPDTADGAVHKLQRDISQGKCIFRLWGPADPNASGKTLGNGNSQYMSTDPRKLQAHPANRPLVNIGELGRIFAKSAYNIPDPSVDTPPAESLLIDVSEPVYQTLFNYLTVIDHAARNSNLPQDEMRVKGRININTAPVFVLAQLPWMRQYREAVPFERARAVVDYRNRHGAFKSIAELISVPEMRRLADPNDPSNNLFEETPRGPDLTPDDVLNDLEERDLIFTRISNLVTVRSDVFTAYILVRIGTDGPQKRVVAIFDRGQTMSRNDPVRILSLEQVPDPR